MSELNCEQASLLLVDYASDRLEPDLARTLHAHLRTCPACAQAGAEERVLSELLSTRLPRPAAPTALREELAQQIARSLARDAFAEAERSEPPDPLPGFDSAGAPGRLLAQGGAGAEPENREPRGLPPSAADGRGRRARASAAPPGRRSAAPGQPRRQPGWRTVFSAAAAAVLTVALGLSWFDARRDGVDPIFREARNDHLRVLYAARPIEIENGGIHQVKPWFSGRVDFAPDIAFAGDDEFPMLGGAVGYFLDRKAASFVYKRRLHTISLFVFRDHGLDWPEGPTRPIGPVSARIGKLDGFNLVLWRANGLGHALVSDVSAAELEKLCAKLNAE